jgi:hypothetical protein
MPPKGTHPTAYQRRRTEPSNTELKVTLSMSYPSRNDKGNFKEFLGRSQYLRLLWDTRTPEVNQ